MTFRFASASEIVRLGRLSILPVAFASLASGCREAQSEPTNPPAKTEQVIAIVDRSSSVTPTETRHQQQVLSSLVEGLSFGDRLVLIVAHAKGIRTDSAIPPVEMPVANNVERPLSRENTALKSAKTRALRQIDRLFARGTVAGTDLLATLHTAEDAVHDAGDRDVTLIVLSDMLQCADGVCMEGQGGVPSASWVAQKSRDGTIPNLRNACVSAVGADDTSARGVDVRDFWARYFAASGAQFSTTRYRHAVTRIESLRCV